LEEIQWNLILIGFSPERYMMVRFGEYFDYLKMLYFQWKFHVETFFPFRRQTKQSIGRRKMVKAVFYSSAKADMVLHCDSLDFSLPCANPKRGFAIAALEIRADQPACSSSPKDLSNRAISEFSREQLDFS
jgi:hypothetical protein